MLNATSESRYALLSEKERQRLTNTMDSFGGKVSYRRTPDGRDQPYEVNIAQFTLHLGLKLFGFWRQSMRRDQSIFCIHNISDEIQQVALSDINLIGADHWFDLISGMAIENLSGSITLKLYQSVWLSNREFSRE